MKLSDIDKIHEAGLVSSDQREKIISHFKLHEEGHKFLSIVSLLGALLVVCGFTLLIAANWEDIPDSIKLFSGLSLMLALNILGYVLKESRQTYPKIGEACHVMAAGLFLGNIALIGQVYNLSSRLPNAFLIWAIGITPLAWILRSKAQYVLSLLAWGTWWICEVFAKDSLLHPTISFFNGECLILFVSFLGLAYLALSTFLQKSSFSDFSESTRKLALLVLNFSLYPFAWREIYGWNSMPLGNLFFILLTLLCILNLIGLLREKDLDLSGKISFLAMLLLSVAMIWVIPKYGFRLHSNYYFNNESNRWLLYILFPGMLFAIAFLQTRIGLLLKSPFMMNFGLVTIGFVVLAVYISLFKNMTNSGFLFLGAGVFMVILAIVLEKQRRSMSLKMKQGGV